MSGVAALTTSTQQQPLSSMARCQGGARSSLVDKLCSIWLTQLPHSGLQGCSNVLWACVRPGPGAVQRIWGPTWDAYIQQVLRDADIVGPHPPQDLSKVFWACAKLRKQPSSDELQLLLQTFLQPAVLADAQPQAVANVVWALGALCRLPGWQGGVTEQNVQQLLGKQQLQLLAAGSSQGTSNVLLGLANMAAGAHPVISAPLAHECGKQLLAAAYCGLASWSPQHITNAMWVCGELGLANEQFFAAAVAAAPKWLPHNSLVELTQAASACAKLQYRDEGFLIQVLKQAGVLLRQSNSSPAHRGRGSNSLAPKVIDSTFALFSLRVAELNMPQLAGPMRDLTVESGISRRPDTHPANLGRLWVFHSWLLQHQLLDWKGLAGVLTQQQLQQGAESAAKFYGTQLSV